MPSTKRSHKEVSPAPSKGCPMHKGKDAMALENDEENTTKRSPSKRSKNSSSNPSDYRYGRVDGPVKCTWFPGTTEKSPHFHEKHDFGRKKIMNTVLENIGNTPLVRINRITKREGVKCEILAKCEFFNAGGSVKDRIGLRMIEDAEKSGKIKPGYTLIEPTSGNTGIGLALGAAIKGYRIIITLPEKMSAEKVNVLKALGAEIIRTPDSAAFDSPDSHIGVAKRLLDEIPNSVILDQYANPGNPLAHYDHTAEEILWSCDNKVDYLVCAAGTGGTLTGTARKIKERCPGVQIIAVDPIGSILAEPDSLNDYNRLKPYHVEGTGYDFIPTVLDREIADRWMKTGDRESFLMSRRLIREEGLLCGGSCGSAMSAAVRLAKELDLAADKRIVVMLPDSTRNYMTKFLSDDWMYEKEFVDENLKHRPQMKTWWSAQRVADLKLQTPMTITPTVTCQEAIAVLSREGFDELPVVSEDNEILGVVTEGNLSAKLVSGRVAPEDAITNVTYSQFKQVSMNTSLGELAHIFDRDHYALVITEQRCFSGKAKEMSTRTVVSGVVTRIDLLDYISDPPEGKTTNSPLFGPRNTYDSPSLAPTSHSVKESKKGN